MKRKILSVLLTVALILSFGLMAVPVAAVAPSPPTIDGVASLTEWAGATPIPVADGMGTINVIAFPDYLYVLFTVTDSTDAREDYEGERGNDQISVNINPTAGVGTWGFPYDLIFETSALSDGACGECPDDGGHHCLPWNPKVNSGTLDEWATRWFPNDIQQDLPSELQSATTYTGANRVTEWRLPLVSEAGATLKVGGAIDVGDGNSYVYPVGLDWNNPATFADISVQNATSVGAETEVLADLIQINVNPTFLDFEQVYRGQSSTIREVTIENTGTVSVDVSASTDSLFYQVALTFSGDPVDVWGVTMAYGASSHVVDAQVHVPSDWDAGIETGTIIFWAEATP